MERPRPAWLNLKSAKRYTDLGESVLRRLVNDPDGLSHVRISGRIIISIAELDRFLAERVQTGAAKVIAGVSPDVLQQVEKFVANCCAIGPGRVEAASTLYRSFTAWSVDRCGDSGCLVTQRSFGLTLRQLGFVRTRGSAGRRLWRGVALRSSAIAPLSALICAT